MHQLSHPPIRTIFDVANHLDTLTGSHAAALKRIFRITSAQAKCVVGPELADKYKVEQENRQTVISVTNMHTLEQTWFNQARTTKPQTFNNSNGLAASNLDPTDNGAKCDFCAWPRLTAQDPGFGRIQLPHAVTGSNLFKYAEPSHGIVMFKHHDPLVFSGAALSDLLDASWLWFQECHKLNPQAAEPFLLWNCLPRAGASQYHGHAQVMLSSVPVPTITRLQQAADHYQEMYKSLGCCYYADLLKAHAAVGLTRQISIPLINPELPAGAGLGDSDRTMHAEQLQQHVAWGFASLAPFKDAEITVVGQHLCCPAFQRMLHAALRALIDGLGCCTFNMGVLNLDLSAPPPAGVGLGRLHWNNQIDGHDTAPAISSSTCSTSAGNSHGSHQSSSSLQMWLPDHQHWAVRPPVVARLASRGKLSSAASDFGALEVWGGASIGHTDPFLVVKQLDVQLASTGVEAPVGVHATAN